MAGVFIQSFLGTKQRNPLCAFLFLFGCFVLAPALCSAQEDPDLPLGAILQQVSLENPTLESARARVRAVAEDIAQAESGWFPDIRAQGNISYSDSDTLPAPAGGEGSSTEKRVALSVEQPVWRGGRTVADIKAARAQLGAETALLVATEQSILRETATVYMDMIRDQAVLSLQENNLDLITRQLEASRKRFAVGDLTRTDVSQAESRLARAQANVIAAKADLATRLADYERIVGVPFDSFSSLPTKGVLPDPVKDLTAHLPLNREDAIEKAMDSNPLLHAARFTQEAASHGVDLVFGELLPTVSLSGNVSRSYDPSSGRIDRRDSSTFGLSASIPLYPSGGVHARLRQAKHNRQSKYLDVIEAQRFVRGSVITAWENLEAARAAITARDSQVEAARTAREGVHREASLGTRTVLDSLDADQEYLDAQVERVRAGRDEIVARFILAESLGILTPEIF